MRLSRRTAGPDEPSERLRGRPPWLTVGWLARVMALLARRPGLWSVAVRQLFQLAARNWWRRAPFLPLPPPDYLRFRLQTMYGGSEHAPDPRDLVRWLAWCRSQNANC